MILPSGTVEMVFNLAEDELRIYEPDKSDHPRTFSGALLSGPYTRPFMIDTKEEPTCRSTLCSASGISCHTTMGSTYHPYVSRLAPNVRPQLSRIGAGWWRVERGGGHADADGFFVDRSRARLLLIGGTDWYGATCGLGARSLGGDGSGLRK
jgi:hypothetical protein